MSQKSCLQSNFFLFNPVNQAPRLESMENMMKLSQMIIQALDEKSSPLVQLPHITPDMLRHFMTRKVSFSKYPFSTGYYQETKNLLQKDKNRF